MFKMLGSIAAAAMLIALAIPDPAAAAGRHESGIHKQVTDFSSQYRYVRHRYHVRRYVVPRYYGYGYPYRYGYYRYGYPSYGYGYGYPYYRPYPYYGTYFRFGPFGFGVW
jgi:hypothetical protein